MRSGSEGKLRRSSPSTLSSRSSDPRSTFLVLGATGFLGSEVCRQLLLTRHGQTSSTVLVENNEKQLPKVVTLVRSRNLNPQLVALPIDVKVLPSGENSITREVLEEVLHNECNGHITGIFHLAGLVKHSNDTKDVQAMYEANVRLSDVVFEFAMDHGIRTVYSSSSGVVGCQVLADKLRVAHDDSPFCSVSVEGLPYYEQKVAIERKWREVALSGRAPIIFLRPSLLLGPGDERLSSTRVVVDHMNSKTPFKVVGGVSFVDVRDAAQCFIRAMLYRKSVESGCAMNITAENISFDEFSTMLEKGTGIRGSRITLPATATRVGARLLTWFNATMGKPRDESVDPVFAEMGCRYWNVSCQRAKELLQYEPRPSLDTITDTASYIHSTPGLMRSRSSSPAPFREASGGQDGEEHGERSGSTKNRNILLLVVAFLFFTLFFFVV